MEQVVIGSFFGKYNEGSPIDAQLHIYEDGGCSLKADDIFSEGDNIWEDYLLGDDEQGRRYSLLGVSYKTKVSVSIGGSRKSELFPRLMVVGDRHIKSIDSITIDTFSVRLDCDSWFYENSYYASQKYIPPHLRPAFELKYDETTNIGLSSQRDMATGKRVTVAVFKAGHPQGLKYFQDAVHYLVTFLSFACRSALPHGGITFRDAEGFEYELHYKPAFYPGDKESNNNLFNYKVSDLQGKFTRWMGLYDKAPAIFKLYFLARLIKLESTVRFLMATQALECFNRKFHNEKLTFVERAKDIIEGEGYHAILSQVGGVEQIGNLHLLIRDTRNYFTHYNEDLKHNSDEQGLFFLTFKVELLLDLYLLAEIGFTSDEFEAIKYPVIDDRFNRRENLHRDYFNSDAEAQR
ncbi:HEPN domain-containing protein [Pseudomonas sp. MF6776]|uniref:HEPN domain-containing protein n=1 Tax=Pseudomonas sp. MF6776 TaxID=2797534 RepID=UPI001909F847|nr:HEPN domain-containing protein [Pseudomonas sp. MF6776]MBK3468185.1 hypothetical protein [Pseudomonas sp. MF6776]